MKFTALMDLKYCLLQEAVVTACNGGDGCQKTKPNISINQTKSEHNSQAILTETTEK